MKRMMTTLLALLPALAMAQSTEQVDDLSKLAPGVSRGVAFMCVNSSDSIDASDFGTVRCGSTRQLMVEAIQSGTWNVAVSGTFWQATQPVSIATMPSTPVTGTFWQATQPVSGTFWQATQPISGTVTANAGSGTLAVSGPVTDTQLRATPVPVSGTVTANAGSGTLAVSGPVTDTQLRATPVPVSGTVTANAGSGTMAVSGPLTDTQLRATAVPVSGTVTVTDGAGALNVIVDSATLGTVTVSDGAGSLNTILDSGTLTSITNAVTVAQATAANLNATVTDGTGPLTVDGTVAATQSGAWNVTNVSGTVSLPTGAATLAEQQTQTTAINALDVAQGSTTSGQSGPLVQAAVTTSAPSYTDAKTSPLNMGVNGLLRVDAFPVRWTCALDNIAATLTQCQAAAGAGLRHWVTHVVAVSTTSTAATFAIRTGTGTNCGTATAGLMPGASTSRTYVLPANTAAAWQMSSTSGVGATAAHAICAIGAATNTLNVVISGYTAP